MSVAVAPLSSAALPWSASPTAAETNSVEPDRSNPNSVEPDHSNPNSVEPDRSNPNSVEPEHGHLNPLTADRLGMASFFFLAAVVTSLCGAWMELLIRRFNLPLNPTQPFLLAGFLLMACKPGSRGHVAHLWLAVTLLFFVGWGGLGMSLRTFPDWDRYKAVTFSLCIGISIAFCTIWLPKQRGVLFRLGVLASLGLGVMAMTFLPYVLTGSHPPGPRIRSWHIHGGIARLPWTLDDPNFFSSNILLLLAMSHFAWRQATERLTRTVCLGGLAAGMILLMLTMSRAGLGGLVLGFTAYSFLQGRKALATYVFIAAIVLVGVAMSPVGEYILSRFVGVVSGDTSTSVRLQQYMFAFTQGMDHPFGLGLGQSLRLAEETVLYRIHSSIMEPFAEFGLFGFAVLAFGTCLLLYRWMRLGGRLAAYRACTGSGKLLWTNGSR